MIEKLDREEGSEDALAFKRWKHEEANRRPLEEYRGT